MVLWQLLAAVRRHPLVAVAGVVLTFLVAGVVYQWPPVYSTRVSVLFLNPRPTGAAPIESVNPYQGSRTNLVMTAGVVARMLDQGGNSTKAGSDSISLVGMGVKSGYAFTLPNSGSQWVFEFRKAELDLQVVGRSEAEVQRLLEMATGEVDGALRTRQREAGTPESQWIRLSQSPTDAVIVAQGGDRRRAAAMTVLLGGMLTLTAVQAVRDDRRRLPLLPRRRPVAGDGPDPGADARAAAAPDRHAPVL